MSRRTLIELGWDARRFRILLRVKEWEWLEAYANSTTHQLPDLIGLFVSDGIRERQADERVDLTLEGEKAAAEPLTDLGRVKLGSGGTQW